MGHFYWATEGDTSIGLRHFLYWRLTRLDFAATMTLPPDLYDGLDPTPAASVIAYTDSCTNATILAKGRRLSYSTWLPTRTIEPDLSRITSTIGVLKKPLTSESRIISSIHLSTEQTVSRRP